MKRITIILLASLISITLFSTENTLITGRLIDIKTDEALTFALITILDSENNIESICMSNDNGEFTLKYNPNSIVFISHFLIDDYKFVFNNHGPITLIISDISICWVGNIYL